jgi:acetyl coenzyme A synthetase (ADP forming)-like protein
MNAAPEKMLRDPRTYAVDEILRDGGSIHLRAIRPDDKSRLLEHFRHLSRQSAYYRFFRVKKQLTDEELRQFTELDFQREVALVATLRDGAEERIIGVARYGAPAAGQAHCAEVAFAVADAHQGRGIGTLLLEHLVPIARAHGITVFEADVLGENNRMMRVFAKSGFVVSRAIDAGVFHVTFPTAETPEFVEASRARERAAAAESVRGVLAPRAVAVVGASRHAGTIGATLLANLRHGGFRGPIYPVHPQATEIQGLHAYPTVSAIGAPVDLAVIAVPAAAVEEVVADCARAGVRGVVVVSAGFGEISAAGKEAERRLTHLVRESGMRLVGPNCIGVINTDPAIALNATFATTYPTAGNIGMLSQSGALGIAVLQHMRARHLGLSSFVSVGNKADVSSNDLLAYWADDPRTRVIVLYLESFGNPRKFAWAAPAVARAKPIIAVKSGRSAAGRRAASSHSAALASLDVAVDALFEQAGVIRTTTLEELFDVAALLAAQPAPPGPRVGVVTNAGGPAILLADACEAHGLSLPELALATRAALRGFLPPQAGLGNPVDMIASATPEQYARAIAAVGADPQVDAVVAVYVPVLLETADEVAAAIARGAGAVPPTKPVLAVFLSAVDASPALAGGARGRIPAYGFPENAAIALAAAARYESWRRRPRGTTLELDAFACGAVRSIIDRALAGATAPRWLDEHELATVLRAVGIEFAAFERAAPADAVATAERLGYPLVAKAIAPDLLHKSDVGGVILGLDSARSVADGVATLHARLAAAGRTLESVLLQREIPGGIEALVGVTTDPTFGPLVVCGLGGVLVEILHDAAFRLPPVSDLDAEEMLAKLRASTLLDGYRGAPPGDRAALVDVIRRISALIAVVPELRELDLNPLKVGAPGKGAIVVDGRMRIGPLAPAAGA